MTSQVTKPATDERALEIIRESKIRQLSALQLYLERRLVQVKEDLSTLLADDINNIEY